MGEFCGILGVPHNIVMDLDNVMVYLFILITKRRLWCSLNSFNLPPGCVLMCPLNLSG